MNLLKGQKIFKLDLLGGRLVELRECLAARDPHLLARNTGAAFQAISGESGVFQLEFWGQPVAITFPALEVREADTGVLLADFSQAMLLYYLSNCDGTPVAGKWIAFSELPDGRFYNSAFQGYTGRELACSFSDDLGHFSRTAEILGGERVYLFGDAAYKFQALPLVSLLVVAWLGDADFPTNYQILFDANVSHHLPTDACAVLGSTLTRRLIRAIEQPPHPQSPSPIRDERIRDGG